MHKWPTNLDSPDSKALKFQNSLACFIGSGRSQEDGQLRGWEAMSFWQLLSSYGPLPPCSPQALLTTMLPFPQPVSLLVLRRGCSFRLFTPFCPRYPLLKSVKDSGGVGVCGRLASQVLLRSQATCLLWDGTLSRALLVLYCLVKKSPPL